MLLPPTVYKKYKSKIIPGIMIEAFVKVRDRYELKRLRVYADETIAGDYLQYNLPIDQLYRHVKKIMPKIKKEHLKGSTGISTDENMNTVSFRDFKYLVKKRFVTQGFKDTIYIDSDLIGYVPIKVNTSIKDAEFIKAVEDIIYELNDKPSSLRKCMNTLCEFLLASKVKKELFRKILYKAYLAVPEHQRGDVYPLSIDLEGKTPIEDIIYKRESRLDDYDNFVKAYGDDYFESKYKIKVKIK